MIVLDTNVLVRLVTKDDIEQATAAFALLRRGGPFWIGSTALLELGWVLGSKRYGYARADVSRALKVVANLADAHVEDLARVRDAMTLYDEGHDLGDAFILAFSPSGATVATFDDGFVARSPIASGTGRTVRRVADLVSAPR